MVSLLASLQISTLPANPLVGARTPSEPGSTTDFLTLLVPVVGPTPFLPAAGGPTAARSIVADPGKTLPLPDAPPVIGSAITVLTTPALFVDLPPMAAESAQRPGSTMPLPESATTTDLPGAKRPGPMLAARPVPATVALAPLVAAPLASPPTELLRDPPIIANPMPDKSEPIAPAVDRAAPAAPSMPAPALESDFSKPASDPIAEPLDRQFGHRPGRTKTSPPALASASSLAVAAAIPLIAPEGEDPPATSDCTPTPQSVALMTRSTRADRKERPQPLRAPSREHAAPSTDEAATDDGASPDDAIIPSSLSDPATNAAVPMTATALAMPNAVARPLALALGDVPVSPSAGPDDPVPTEPTAPLGRASIAAMSVERDAMDADPPSTSRPAPAMPDTHQATLAAMPADVQGRDSVATTPRSIINRTSTAPRLAVRPAIVPQPLSAEEAATLQGAARMVAATPVRTIDPHTGSKFPATSPILAVANPPAGSPPVTAGSGLLQPPPPVAPTAAPVDRFASTDVPPQAATEPSSYVGAPIVAVADDHRPLGMALSVRPVVAAFAPGDAVIAQGEAPAPEVGAAPRRARSEPAFRAFAGAMFDAVRDAASTIPVGPAAVMTPFSDRAPIDLTQPRWPHAMVDRIERLRDEANLSDTRIRLVPDALGAIDVALRREGDTVHVAFRAEQAETGRLLAEARPELTALAEARGIKLADAAPVQTTASASGTGWTGTQSGTGSNGGERAPRQQPQASTPAAPIRRVQTDEAPGDDTRIA